MKGLVVGKSCGECQVGFAEVGEDGAADTQEQQAKQQKV